MSGFNFVLSVRVVDDAKWRQSNKIAAGSFVLEKSVVQRDFYIKMEGPLIEAKHRLEYCVVGESQVEEQFIICTTFGDSTHTGMESYIIVTETQNGHITECMKEILRRVNATTRTVRTTYKHERVNIHFDDVEDVGKFVQLECVIKHDDMALSNAIFNSSMKSTNELLTILSLEDQEEACLWNGGILVPTSERKDKLSRHTRDVCITKLRQPYFPPTQSAPIKQVDPPLFDVPCVQISCPCIPLHEKLQTLLSTDVEHTNIVRKLYDLRSDGTCTCSTIICEVD